MRAFDLVASLAIASSLAACHDDACVWSVARTKSEARATFRADSVAVEAVVAATSATTSQRLKNDARTTRFRLALSVPDDASIDAVILDVPLADGQTDDLAGLGSTFKLMHGETIVAEGTPSGVLRIELLRVNCELSDAYHGTGRSWTCATNADVTVDATFQAAAAQYGVSASLSQREQLSEECHPCEGIEGCDY